MTDSHLKMLNDAAVRLVRDERIAKIIAGLEEDLGSAKGPFVWAVLDPLPEGLPENIESAWIFVLKDGVPSGRHYHPNSVQHMVVTEGKGRAVVGGETREMLDIHVAGHSLEDIWYVIEPGVEHEFFPEGGDMVVISFHTCPAHDLEEISTTGERRFYEPHQ